MKWEDSLFLKIVAMLGSIMFFLAGIMSVARGAGPFKIAGAVIAIASIYGFIKALRLIKIVKNELKEEK